MVNYADEAIGLPLGYYNPHQKYGYYASLEALTRAPSTHPCHPGPFGTPQEWVHYAEEANKRRYGNDAVSSFEARGKGAGRYGRVADKRSASGGQPFNLDLLLECKGNGGCGGPYSNTLKRHKNLFYCPNKGCGYDVDHNVYEFFHASPWDNKRGLAHFHGREGASMKGQHKTLDDGTVVGIGWLLAGQIIQAQWMM